MAEQDVHVRFFGCISSYNMKYYYANLQRYYDEGNSGL